MDKITQDLKNFYDNQSTNFHISRKKSWPEFEHIIWVIKKNKSKNINILELWCWDWRFAKHLDENVNKMMYYTWVDISTNLVQIAQETNPDAEFIIDEMNNYLDNIEQESLDFIIMIASFQHISTSKKRIEILKKAYKWLKYWWKLIMINWSFSNRFIKKYKLSILFSWLKSFLTLGFHKINDLYIPWKDWKKTYKRYYHIFTTNELYQLINISWFIMDNIWYIDSEWNLTQQYINSRNSFVVAEKEIISK